MIHEPKALLSKDAAQKFGELFSSPDAQKYLQSALCQLHYNIANAPDMGTAAAGYWKIEGARSLIAILCSLHEAPIVSPRSEQGVLRQ